MMRGALALIGLVGLASACAAPPAAVERMPEGGVLLSRFGDARAVATDRAGRLYVADAAASEVVVLDTTGAVLNRLGGTEDQPFLDVADVDPTNGQAVFVADAGGGRIVRFTAEGRAVEVISVPRVADLDGRHGGEGIGRPVAVASGPGDVLYAIEAERGVVLRWNANRQLDRVLGGPASSMPLRSPHALALSETGSLLVADQDRIVVFDAFGAVEGSVSVEGAGRVGNVAIGEGTGLAVTDKGVLRLDGFVGIPADVGEPLVDVAIGDRHAFLLTSSRLVRVPLELESSRPG